MNGKVEDSLPKKDWPSSVFIGILEELYRRREIQHLREIYEELLRQNIRVDLRTLRNSLAQFGLPRL